MWSTLVRKDPLNFKPIDEYFVKMMYIDIQCLNCQTLGIRICPDWRQIGLIVQGFFIQTLSQHGDF